MVLLGGDGHAVASDVCRRRIQRWRKNEKREGSRAPRWWSSIRANTAEELRWRVLEPGCYKGGDLTVATKAGCAMKEGYRGSQTSQRRWELRQRISEVLFDSGGIAVGRTRKGWVVALDGSAMMLRLLPCRERGVSANGVKWVDGEKGLTANGRSFGQMCAAVMGLCAMGFAGQGAGVGCARVCWWLHTRRHPRKRAGTVWGCVGGLPGGIAVEEWYWPWKAWVREIVHGQSRGQLMMEEGEGD